MPKLYTIGHSITDLATFLTALTKHNVTQLVDVRSQPHSRRHPQFNQEALETSLREAGVDYLFLGKELGGRPQAYAADGVVDYNKWRQSKTFQAGLAQFQQKLTSHTVAIMCAEEDPLTCHRFLLIGPALTALGIEPAHIRKGAAIETQQQADDRLLHAQKLSAAAATALFALDRDAALQTAYAKQSQQHAFRLDRKAGMTATHL